MSITTTRPSAESRSATRPHGWRTGEVRHRVWKTLLPTYDVFDERRYFEPGESSEPIVWNGHRIGVTICEDIWTE